MLMLASSAHRQLPAIWDREQLLPNPRKRLCLLYYNEALCRLAVFIKSSGTCGLDFFSFFVFNWTNKSLMAIIVPLHPESILPCPHSFSPFCVHVWDFSGAPRENINQANKHLCPAYALILKSNLFSIPWSHPNVSEGHIRSNIGTNKTVGRRGARVLTITWLCPEKKQIQTTLSSVSGTDVGSKDIEQQNLINSFEIYGVMLQ